MPAIQSSGRQSSGRQSSGRQSSDKPQTFRSPTAVVIWFVWLLFAVGNWIDLAIQGRDHTSAVAAAILLLATGARLRHRAAAPDHRRRRRHDDQEPAAGSPDRLDRRGPGGSGRRAARALRMGPAPQGHQRLGGALLTAASAGHRGQGPQRGPAGRTAPVPAVRRPRVRPGGLRGARRRGRSGEGRAGAPRARDRGPGRSRLGGRARRRSPPPRSPPPRSPLPRRPPPRSPQARSPQARSPRPRSPVPRRPGWTGMTGPSPRRARGAAGRSPPWSFPR